MPVTQATSRCAEPAAVGPEGGREGKGNGVVRTGATGPRPTDNPLDIGAAGFYRRWRTAIDEKELATAVASLTATTQDQWIPVWKEHGPVTGKEARIFRGAGHGAPEHAQEWVPAAFSWLTRTLSAAVNKPPSGSHPSQEKEPLA